MLKKKTTTKHTPVNIMAPDSFLSVAARSGKNI